jgi:hypothetical protein
MKYYCIYIFLPLLLACSTNIPKEFIEAKEHVSIFPDYTNLIIPANIAPLNFAITNDADEYLVSIQGKNGDKIISQRKKTIINYKKWKKLLENNKGAYYSVTVFIKKDKKWHKFPTFINQISGFSIDEYLSYRLIEPGYVSYGNISLRQRNITNFDERDIFNNYISRKNDDLLCLNCHAYQNYKTSNMQFHGRNKHGGTIIVRDGKPEKIDIKTEKLISGGVYPAWHPSENLIAYSVNNTGQVFHSHNIQKVEVQDMLSDLILYDTDKNTVSFIANDSVDLETFPAWSPDGKTLYYSSSPYIPAYANRSKDAVLNYDKIRYNIMRKSFDIQSRTFGEAEMVFNADSISKSATLPRISPDGKYLLFSMGSYGTFHIWHKDSDLYLMELKTGNMRKLENVNSSDVESYHTWSSNGRWIVFSSRRDDGSFTRSYISYFDENGRASKPFILPQKDPYFYSGLYKSFNIPEFMTEPVNISVHEFREAFEKDAVKAVMNE